VKNLERAVRLFRALVETGSDVQVTSSTLWSWPETREALASAEGDPGLLVEMAGLPEAVRERTLRYCGTLAPLNPKGDVYVFPNVESADRFVEEMGEDVTAIATHLADGVVSAYGETIDAVTATALRHGGTPYVGPSLTDAFESVDVDLPYLMIQEGFDPREVEVALIEALWKDRDQAMNEAFFMHAPADRPSGKYRGRLAQWATPRPVLGVNPRLVEALRMSGALPRRLCLLLEADPNAAAVSPTSPGAATSGDQGASGGTSTEPENAGGAPAQSQQAPDKEPPKPTEHVPTREEGGTAMGQVKLPDGTVVPPEIMRQALGKMLHNLATQVEQNTTNGKPADKAQDQGAQDKQAEPPEVDPNNPAEPPKPEAPPAAQQPPPAGAPPPAPAPGAPQQQESTITEDLHRALGLLKSPRPRDVLAGVGMVRQAGFSGQPQSVVERVLDEFNALKGSPNARVRRAVNGALESDLYRTDRTMIPILPEGLDYGSGQAEPGTAVIIVEDRGSKVVIQLPSGERVLAPARAIALVEANGKPRGATSLEEATRVQVGDSVLAPETFSLNVNTINGAQARNYAEKLYSQADDAVLERDLPNLDRNFALLKKKMRHAKNLRREEMPVIDPKDIQLFGKRLAKGHIDLFAPWGDVANLFGPAAPAKFGGGMGGGAFPTWKDGMQGGSKGRVWVTLGRTDGDKDDDKVSAKIRMVAVKDLKPLQKEIWYDKLIASILKHNPPKAGGYLLTNAIIIVSKEGYILDGHHRFGQAMLTDPSLQIKALVIPLDIDTLLKVGLSYGAAIGHAPRESVDMIQGQGALYSIRNPMAQKKPMVLGPLAGAMGESESLPDLWDIVADDMDLTESESHELQRLETLIDALCDPNLSEDQFSLMEFSLRKGLSSLASKVKRKVSRGVARVSSAAKGAAAYQQHQMDQGKRGGFSVLAKGARMGHRKVQQSIRKDNRADQVDYIQQRRKKNAERRRQSGSSRVQASRVGNRKARRESAMAESINEQLYEQLDVGQDDEIESTARGFQATAAKLKTCRQHTFDLVTKDLVQLESLAKAVGAKRTIKLLSAMRDKATDFLDALKETAELLDKANEAYKGEGGKGGDTLDQEAAAAAAPVAAPVPAPVPGAPPAPAPAVAEGLRRIAQTTIPRRIAAGETYSDIVESIQAVTAGLGLSNHQVAEVYDRVNALTLHDDGTPEFSVELSTGDHRLLESVQRYGGLVRGLVRRTQSGRRTLATRTELREAASTLRSYGKVEHGMLADDLEAIVAGAC